MADADLISSSEEIRSNYAAAQAQAGNIRDRFADSAIDTQAKRTNHAQITDRQRKPGPCVNTPASKTCILSAA